MIDYNSNKKVKSNAFFSWGKLSLYSCTNTTLYPSGVHFREVNCRGVNCTPLPTPLPRSPTPPPALLVPGISVTFYACHVDDFDSTAKNGFRDNPSVLGADRTFADPCPVRIQHLFCGCGDFKKYSTNKFLLYSQL